MSRGELEALERQLEGARPRRPAHAPGPRRRPGGVRGPGRSAIRTGWSASCSTWSAAVEEAEDLTQDVFLRIYRARKGYRPRAKFSTWLFTIANNLALNHLRGKGRNPSVAHERGRGTDSQAVAPVAAQLASREGTASSQMRKVELSEVVREALEVLGEDQKMAVLLNKFEDMSYAEIAEVMGRSPAAVKSLLARAATTFASSSSPTSPPASAAPAVRAGSSQAMAPQSELTSRAF